MDIIFIDMYTRFKGCGCSLVQHQRPDWTQRGLALPAFTIFTAYRPPHSYNSVHSTRRATGILSVPEKTSCILPSVTEILSLHGIDHCLLECQIYEISEIALGLAFLFTHYHSHRWCQISALRAESLLRSAKSCFQSTTFLYKITHLCPKLSS